MSRRARSASCSAIRRPVSTSAVAVVAPGVQQQGRRVDRRGGLADRHLHDFGFASRVTPRDTRPASAAQATSSARPPSAIAHRRQRIRQQKAARRPHHRVIGMHRRARRRCRQTCPRPSRRGARARTHRAGPATCCRCRQARAPANRRRSRPRRAAPADRRCALGSPISPRKAPIIAHCAYRSRSRSGTGR